MSPPPATRRLACPRCLRPQATCLCDLVCPTAHLSEVLGSGQGGAFATTLANLQAAGLSAEQALAQVNRLVDQQAYTRAADDIFLVSAMIFLGLIALIWITRRPPRLAAPADAGGAH